MRRRKETQPSGSVISASVCIEFNEFDNGANSELSFRDFSIFLKRIKSNPSNIRQI